MSAKIFDITLPLNPELAVWPGSCPVGFTQVKSMKSGDLSNDTEIKINVHSGTHIDAPSHFIADGKTIDQIPAHKFIGPVYVCEILGISEITAAVLNRVGLPSGTKKLLIKTDNSELWTQRSNVFHKNFVALKSDAARLLVDSRIELVGVDYLSVQQFGDSPDTHKILLSNQVVVLEGVDLSQVNPGFYELICLPIKLAGVEAAPVRALLLSEDGNE